MEQVIKQLILTGVEDQSKLSEINFSQSICEVLQNVQFNDDLYFKIKQWFLKWTISPKIIIDLLNRNISLKSGSLKKQDLFEFKTNYNRLLSNSGNVYEMYNTYEREFDNFIYINPINLLKSLLNNSKWVDKEKLIVLVLRILWKEIIFRTENVLELFELIYQNKEFANNSYVLDYFIDALERHLKYIVNPTTELKVLWFVDWLLDNDVFKSEDSTSKEMLSKILHILRDKLVYTQYWFELIYKISKLPSIKTDHNLRVLVHCIDELDDDYIDPAKMESVLNSINSNKAIVKINSAYFLEILTKSIYKNSKKLALQNIK